MDDFEPEKEELLATLYKYGYGNEHWLSGFLIGLETFSEISDKDKRIVFQSMQDYIEDGGEFVGPTFTMVKRFIGGVSQKLPTKRKIAAVSKKIQDDVLLGNMLQDLVDNHDAIQAKFNEMVPHINDPKVLDKASTISQRQANNIREMKNIVDRHHEFKRLQPQNINFIQIQEAVDDMPLEILEKLVAKRKNNGEVIDVDCEIEES